MKSSPAISWSFINGRNTDRVRAWHWILAGGLLAGTLELLFATIWWAPAGVTPGRILQVVAGWVIGRETALAGAGTTALLGAGVHYTLMIAIVAGWFALSLRWRELRRHPFIAGALYGALSFVLIHKLALPLLGNGSAHPVRPAWELACLLAYMLLVGCPAALLANTWHSRRMH